jgi:hypothetical protein
MLFAHQCSNSFLLSALWVLSTGVLRVFLFLSSFQEGLQKGESKGMVFLVFLGSLCGP